MGQTYYDSTLTDAQIQQVLDAINNILSPSNNGKVLAISGGTLEARSVQWGGGYPEPTGSITLTSNGLHNVKDYAEANVQVQGGGAVIQPLTVTQDGIYNPPSGVDGYAPVTVNVNDDPALPSGYTKLNYIESTGTQWINTAVAANSRIRYDIEFALPEIPQNWQFFIGAGRGNADQSFSIIINSDKFSFQHTPDTIPSNAPADFLFQDVNFQFAENVKYHGLFQYGASLGNVYFPFNSLTTNRNIQLFKPTWASSLTEYIKARIFRLKIFTGLVLSRYFVPAMRDSDGVVGLFDFVSNTLFVNAGTGNFLYG